MLIGDKTLYEWRAFARRDDCLDQMVPSDLRIIVGRIATLSVAMERAANIIDKNLYHQREKVADAAIILRQAINN